MAPDRSRKQPQADVEMVVLVDEDNQVLETVSKSEVHTQNTRLHRAFSVYIFNEQNQLLLQQRSRKKETWPLVWSNSCCGHPGPGESNIEAARRRISQELNISVGGIEEISPYRYQFTKAGITENEICPILIAFTSDDVLANENEIEAIRWLDWLLFVAEVDSEPGKYSPWCVEQVEILKGNDRFNELIHA